MLDASPKYYTIQDYPILSNYPIYPINLQLFLKMNEFLYYTKYYRNLLDNWIIGYFLDIYSFFNFVNTPFF